MYDFDALDGRYIIFGTIFLLSNRLQTAMDHCIDELTAKQWFTALMLGLFDEPPTLKQLAACCDSSHQNTKQIVLKLKEKGFICITSDSKDLRAMRIVATDKWRQWNQNNEHQAAQFVRRMFADISAAQIEQMQHTQQKIYANLENMKGEIR